MALNPNQVDTIATAVLVVCLGLLVAGGALAALALTYGLSP